MKQNDFIKDTDSDEIIISNVKKRKLDIVPRLICLVFAIIVWIYFVNINDSSITATFKVKLDVTGTDALKNNSGQIMYGLETQEVTITVKGTNRDLKKYSQTDYSASIDVGAITSSGKHSMEIVPVLPGNSALSLSVVSVEPQNITFYTDLEVTKTVHFEAVKGGEVTTPYQLTIKQDKTTIDITGPKSILDKIETAKYSISGGDYHTSTKFSGFKLEFYDVNNDSVAHDDKIISYSTDNTIVELAVTTQSTMGIQIYSDGVLVSPSAYTCNEIAIVGDPTVILSDAIKNNKIRINVTADDIASGKITRRITSENLPVGVMLTEDFLDLNIEFIKVLE